MADDHTHVFELAEKISICMLATRHGEDLRSRPMATYVRPEENAFYFLSDARHHMDDEIRKQPQVCLAFEDGQRFLSVTGRAEVSSDRAKIKELWGTPAQAWWDNPDDPNIRVLKVTPSIAEYWETPGTVVSTVKMAAAALTGERPDLGETKKVAMQ